MICSVLGEVSSMAGIAISQSYEQGQNYEDMDALAINGR